MVFAKTWLQDFFGVNELIFYTTAEPTLRAATQAAVTKRIINRGLSTPLRSSVIRRYLLFGELAGVALLLPVVKAEAVAFREEIDAWRSGKCTTIWTTNQ
jgi:NADH:ubiquinone oxidoreductase subunit 6 (subunit J)